MTSRFTQIGKKLETETVQISSQEYDKLQEIQSYNYRSCTTVNITHRYMLQEK